MNVIFMGTPDFAVGALEALIEAGHNVTLVVTQPDKQKGRGKEIQYSPVKECALQHQIPVFQPVKIKEAQAVEELRKYEADIFVVAAFGQILSEEILNMPKYGCINIHASLLPKYRGAAPIQWSVINGDAVSGVTIMQMDKGLDTGDILTKEEVVLEPKETGESLFDKLAAAGAKLLIETLPLIEAGTVIPQKQKEEESSYAKMLTKDLGKINWQKSATEIERLIRGCNSWPSAYTYWKKKNLKIWAANVIEDEKGNHPGEITAVDKEHIYVSCGEGTLQICQLQLEGKRRMEVKEFLLGYAVEPGERLG